MFSFSFSNSSCDVSQLLCVWAVGVFWFSLPPEVYVSDYIMSKGIFSTVELETVQVFWHCLKQPYTSLHWHSIRTIKCHFSSLLSAPYFTVSWNRNTFKPSVSLRRTAALHRLCFDVLFVLCVISVFITAVSEFQQCLFFSSRRERGAAQLTAEVIPVVFIWCCHRLVLLNPSGRGL